MQEQSIPKSLIVKLRLPRGFSSKKLEDTASTVTVQPIIDGPGQNAMASSSVGQLAAKKARAPSMHEPQTIVKVSIMVRKFFSPADTEIFNILCKTLRRYYYRYLSPQAIVKIVVHESEETEDPDEPGQEFGIHKTFLYHYSSYFARQFINSEKKVLRI
ncbi:hypothetical protein IFR04_007212 [Cadophora malorum]|uniref:Uncharacterized protein n=1 Tax=Cadophora malorum TaxID=108018 RepID=A0A8H7TI66_9HELO|nr:hypothetical protein IFR04_007212 [Cadophora malorum]